MPKPYFRARSIRLCQLLRLNRVDTREATERRLQVHRLCAGFSRPKQLFKVATQFDKTSFVLGDLGVV